MAGIVGGFLARFSPEVGAAIVAATVSLLTAILALIFTPMLRHVFDNASVRHRLGAEYEYEQRKKLRNLIGKFRGRMLEAAEVLNHRMFNLYANEQDRWLDVDGDYVADNYYFRSMVSRFLGFCCLYREFQSRALYVDSRIAEQSDLDFVKYAKAFEWVVTDVALFDGLPYDRSQPTDHFFRDDLRSTCDCCIAIGAPIGPEDFEKLAAEGRIDSVLRFFDGLSSGESRLRWDRMVAFHILLMAFINEFGYDMQRSTQEQFASVRTMFNHSEIPANLRTWLPALGFERQKEARLLSRVLSAPIQDSQLRRVSPVRQKARTRGTSRDPVGQNQQK